MKDDFCEILFCNDMYIFIIFVDICIFCRSAESAPHQRHFRSLSIAQDACAFRLVVSPWASFHIFIVYKSSVHPFLPS